MYWLKDILQGFYSSRFYYDFAHARKGWGGVYILALAILTTLLLPFYIWQSYPEMHRVIAQLPVLADTLPAIKLDDGKIAIDGQAPFRVNLGDAANPTWVMVDPGYVITDTASLAKVLRDGHVVLLATSDHLMVMRDASGALEMSDLKNYPSFAISHGGWLVLGELIAKRCLTPYILVFIAVTFILLLFYNALLAVITAIVIVLLGWLMSASLTPQAALRLAALVRIPITVLTIAPALMGSPLSAGRSWLLWLFYLVFVVFSCRERVYSRT